MIALTLSFEKMTGLEASEVVTECHILGASCSVVE